MPTTAYLALGANLGELKQTIELAVSALRGADGISLDQISRLYLTKAVGGPEDQPDYLNAAARISTVLSADRLLAVCLEIEARLGRVRLERWGPRTIDLDLLLYGGKIIDLPHLKVPHPEMRNRAFVLMPLSDIAPHDLELPPDRRLLKDVLEDCLQVEKTTRKCYEKKCLVL